MNVFQANKAIEERDDRGFSRWLFECEGGVRVGPVLVVAFDG